MPTTLIFGGSGKVALHLTRILTTKTNPAHRVLSISRSSNHDDKIKAAGGTPVVHSIEDSDPTKLGQLIKEHGPVDTVVWAAGAGGKGGPERTDKVDRDGAILAMDAAAKGGVKRYVMVSAIDVRDRSKGVPEWYTSEMKERGEKSWNAIGRYMAAKLGADKDLVEGNGKRELKYTIVRPSGLTDEPGSGRVEAGKTSSFENISREDVAAVLAEVIKNDSTAGLVFDIVGGETPVEQAVKEVVEKKVNTFEGFH